MPRKINKEARAGSFESNDLIVTVSPADSGINIGINSVVSDMYFDSIKSTVLEELKELGVENANVTIDDRGALPFAIKARVKTAVMRGSGDEL
ncbi:MAG: citrate lyase acyl carrier protein [Ezakiella sp.]|nr:citrate lyase acyl carrier protein [Ezakiella sp.]MDD7471272.1 citrate lyase acyl carrier protein [Bacillota bacterium]MDY3923661.1 citrate lyase acyl carrier protein [Ezakiella sp.]